MVQEKFASLGLGLTKVLLPSKSIDYNKWSVVACDQFTSDRTYWKDVERIVGNSPSTLNMIFPEVYLEENDRKTVGNKINKTMKEYLANGTLVEHDPGFVYIERSTAHVEKRRGLIVGLDLEMYDFTQGTTSPIRPTEATVLERLPARIDVRRQAVLDLPHILVLFDDPQDTIMSLIEESRDSLEKLYDFDLMKEGGHIRGFHISNETLLTAIAERLSRLKKNKPLLFAIGDGNHSLASAKEIWNELKTAGAPEDHPARYALVEIENIHDRGLIFEPIHRVIFDLKDDSFIEGLKEMNGVICEKLDDFDSMKKGIGSTGIVGITWKKEHYLFTLPGEESELEAERLHAYLDPWLKKNPHTLDYIHGDEAYCDLTKNEKNCGIYLPAIDKGDFFTLIDKKGSMPRKTFSLGEAEEKRYYLESSKIVI
jgi:hypothetical protein